jgi:sulfatase modifying factor 1
MTRAPLPSLARIPAGEFLMGAADADPAERPVHRVHVSEFFIGRFAVTHDEYARFVRSAGYPPPALRSLPLVARSGREQQFRDLAVAYEWELDRPPTGRGTHPVVLVAYEDASAYCRWLSEEVGRTVRLPTEAEWEKAARGGLDGRYPWGDRFDPAQCNFLSQPALKAQRGTRPVGVFPPNGYGLYDVSGNVWEWVSDWYAADYYSAGELRDPRGPETGAFRLVRGGSWVNTDPDMLRCAYRHRVPPDTYTHSIGFRIACEP